MRYVLMAGIRAWVVKATIAALGLGHGSMFFPTISPVPYNKFEEYISIKWNSVLQASLMRVLRTLLQLPLKTVNVARSSNKSYCIKQILIYDVAFLDWCLNMLTIYKLAENDGPNKIGLKNTRFEVLFPNIFIKIACIKSLIFWMLVLGR